MESVWFAGVDIYHSFCALAAHTLQLHEVAMIAFTVKHTIKQTKCEMNAHYSSLSIKVWILLLRRADQDT